MLISNPVLAASPATGAPRGQRAAAPSGTAAVKPTGTRITRTAMQQAMHRGAIIAPPTLARPKTRASCAYSCQFKHRCGLKLTARSADDGHRRGALDAGRQFLQNRHDFHPRLSQAAQQIDRDTPQKCVALLSGLLHCRLAPSSANTLRIESTFMGCL